VNHVELDCVSAVAAHLNDQSETSLSQAYELGRRALAQGMGILDVMSLHQVVFRQLVLAAPPSDQPQYANAVDSFFRELLSPFEMSLRGYRETNKELLRVNQDLKETYAALQAKQVQLVQAAKMASLGELVAGIAHEVNNPLAFVVSHLGTASATLDKLGLELGGAAPQATFDLLERARDRIQKSAAGAERIANLVLKLRTFSRLDEGEQKFASVSECVIAVLTILEHRFQGRVDVQTHFGEPDVIECFPSLLNQAIMNLVSNAIDSIQDRGVITISTGKSGDSYSIVVTDTGHGIPESLKQRVFEPFFTTKPVGQGTGLGLSISYSIVQTHRGSLELSSRVGGGTVATIVLPLSAPPRAR
jgi:two-component system, NtrC family, sensor kinase